MGQDQITIHDPSRSPTPAIHQVLLDGHAIRKQQLCCGSVRLLRLHLQEQQPWKRPVKVSVSVAWHRRRLWGGSSRHCAHYEVPSRRPGGKLCRIRAVLSLAPVASEPQLIHLWTDSFTLAQETEELNPPDHLCARGTFLECSPNFTRLVTL